MQSFNSLPPTDNKPSELPPLQDDYNHPMFEQNTSKYHPKQVKIIMSVIVGVVLLGIAIATIIAILPMTTTKKQEPTKKTETVPSSSMTAADTIAHLRVYFKGAETARTSLSTAIKTKNHNFYTIIPDVAVVTPASIGGDLAEQLVQPHITSLEKSLDFDGFLKFPILDGIGVNNYLADFIRNDVICQIQSYKPSEPNKPTFLEVKCADMSAFDTYALEQVPFYTANSAVQASSIPTGFIGKAIIEQSSTPGYTLAEVPVGPISERRPLGSGTVVNQNSRAMYYSGPDRIWHFFTTRVQDASTITCETLMQDDTLRLAYLNKPCYSISKKTQSTVTPKKN